MVALLFIFMTYVLSVIISILVLCVPWEGYVMSVALLRYLLYYLSVLLLVPGECCASCGISLVSLHIFNAFKWSFFLKDTVSDALAVEIYKECPTFFCLFLFSLIDSLLSKDLLVSEFI